MDIYRHAIEIALKGWPWEDTPVEGDMADWEIGEMELEFLSVVLRHPLPELVEGVERWCHSAVDGKLQESFENVVRRYVPGYTQYGTT